MGGIAGQAKGQAQNGQILQERRKSLEEIRQQIEEKRREIEKYRQEEEKISSEIETFKKLEKKTGREQIELEKTLLESRTRNADAKTKFDALNLAYQRRLNSFETDIAEYSVSLTVQSSYYGRKDLLNNTLSRMILVGNYKMLSAIEGEKSRIGKNIRKLKQKQDALQVEKEILAKQKKAHEKLVRSKIKELNYNKEMLSKISDEVKDLQNAANELTRLVEKLKKQSPYRKVSASSGLPLGKNSLPWPAAGALVSRFGKEEIPLLKTKIVRQGIKIRTIRNAPVFPVMEGRVIYSGPFRSYGKVVIIDHEKGFFTVYGLLNEINVRKNDRAAPGSPIGTAGIDTQEILLKKSSGRNSASSDGTLYFEIRSGSEAVDPLPWLQKRQ